MAGTTEELSPIQLQILRALPRIDDIEDLADVARIPPATLGREIALLQLSGHIGEDGQITEKGMEAIRPR